MVKEAQLPSSPPNRSLLSLPFSNKSGPLFSQISRVPPSQHQSRLLSAEGLAAAAPKSGEVDGQTYLLPSPHFLLSSPYQPIWSSPNPSSPKCHRRCRRTLRWSRCPDSSLSDSASPPSNLPLEKAGGKSPNLGLQLSPPPLSRSPGRQTAKPASSRLLLRAVQVPIQTSRWAGSRALFLFHLRHHGSAAISTVCGRPAIQRRCSIRDAAAAVIRFPPRQQELPSSSSWLNRTGSRPYFLNNCR
ncbi:uncharacterized protein LOC130989690 [Salvia miltiorrhiza]|uniref:uncharacterized protein LOC130989690 n=1 Tax=Salvia miltiorrhiza TaxID=226208 RepID=UPI0025AD0DD0|nr:uncharacterized protein LOC130989690 [Salvia miltiorrhiza]